MTKKLNKNGGFTMVELLIVIAIIAILIAISIPMFSSALEGSRHGVDQANYRDAISLGNVEYLSNPQDYKTAGSPVQNYVKYFAYKVNDSTHRGELVEMKDAADVWADLAKGDNATAIKAQCTEAVGADNRAKNGTDSYLEAHLYVAIIPPTASGKNAEVIPIWLKQNTNLSVGNINSNVGIGNAVVALQTELNK